MIISSCISAVYSNGEKSRHPPREPPIFFGTISNLFSHNIHMQRIFFVDQTAATRNFFRAGDRPVPSWHYAAAALTVPGEARRLSKNSLCGVKTFASQAGLAR